jgi:hypothetical protein
MNIRCSQDEELWQAVAAGREKRLREGGFSLADGTGKPAAIITSERYEDLWRAVMAKCEELKQQHKPGYGHRQSAAMIDSDGRGASAILGISQGDGTDLVYCVQARAVPPRGDISASCDGPWLDSHDQFWTEQASDRSNAVVIGDTHYRIKPDHSRPGPGSGFDGQLFRIRMLASGDVIETRNLWHQGTIPPSWRDRLPANAEFITAAAIANPYEAACERFKKISGSIQAIERAAMDTIQQASDEYDAAQANLRQYESQPGIPLPQYREQVQA